MPRLLPLLLGLLIGSSAFAQRDDMREQLREQGDLKGVGPGWVQMASSGGSNWRVQFQRDTRLHFLADADASFLKPGMVVQFNTSVNKKGIPTSPISALSVITPRAANDVGLQPDTGAAEGDNPAKKFFSSETEEPKKPVKKPVVEEVAYRVGGTIVSIKKSTMLVNANGVSLKCELSPTVKVAVDVADLSWAKLGDKVEVNGWYYAQAKPNAYGNEVTVTAAKPLIDEKKKAASAGKDDAKKEDSKNDDEKKE